MAGRILKRRRLTKAEVNDPVLRTLVHELEQAGARLTAAEARVTKQRAILYEAIKRGHASGLGYRRIADATGLSWQRVAQILGASREATPAEGETPGD